MTKVWDRSRKGEPKSQPKKTKVTCPVKGCNLSLVAQNMKQHLMKKHPAVGKAEPVNVRAKNDRELCFYKIVSEV